MNALAFRILGYRLAALGLMVMVFYAWDWLALRETLRDAVSGFIRALGCTVADSFERGTVAMRVADKQFVISADCTYVDLFLVLAPFVWRVRQSVQRNLLRITATVAIVSVLNFLRVGLAIYYHAQGYSWFFVHELPDYLIYYPSIAIVTLMAFREDWKCNCKWVRNEAPRWAGGAALVSNESHANK